MDKLEYLKINIYQGLENLNDGFDVSSIYYFSESDFEKVLDRIEQKGLGLYGIEPWINGNFFDVKSYEEYNTICTDSNWYRTAFEEFKNCNKSLFYAASYHIPEDLID